ncbi:MAG: DotU family type IV/VI secretion system protein [Isosphaeraceae bacterium]
MKESFANVVMPVFREMGRLLDRLEAGETPPLGAVQGQVSGWVQAADRRAAFDPTTRAEYDLCRFGLIAWIDEVLTDSPWGRDANWQDHTLEWVEYQTKDRYTLFYDGFEHAASATPSADPLETYLLCVMMGFQGKFRNDPDGFAEWVAWAYECVSRGAGGQSRPFADDGPPPSGLRPRRGPRILRTVSLLVAGSALATLAAYILSVHWNYQPGS